MTRILLPLAILATGCGPNIGWRDHDPAVPHFLGKRGDHLSGPYAQGSTLSFWIDASRELQGYTVTSSEPAVFELITVGLDDDERLKVVGQAVGAGTSELVLQKPNGKVVETLPVEVRTPDRFELASLALLKTGSDAVLDEVRILAGHEVTVAVTAHDGDQRLGGNAGLLAFPVSDPDLGVSLETREGADHPAYVRLEAPGPLEQTVPILWNEQVALEPTVVSVPAASIDAVTIEGSEAGVEKGSPVYLLASARDAQGRRILGVDADWHLEGDPLVSTGDLYVYDLDPKNPNTLVTRVDDVELRTSILGRGSAAASSEIGCSTGGGAAGWLLLAGLAGLRRR